MLFKKKNCKKWVSCYHSFASDKYFREYSPENCYGLGSMQRVAPNLALFHDMSVLLMTQQVSHLIPQLLCAPAPSQDSCFLLCTQTRCFHSETKGTSYSKGVRLPGLSNYNNTGPMTHCRCTGPGHWLPDVHCNSTGAGLPLLCVFGFTLQRSDFFHFDVKYIHT